MVVAASAALAELAASGTTVFVPATAGITPAGGAMMVVFTEGAVTAVPLLLA
jgi:hypothetical protein